MKCFFCRKYTLSGDFPVYCIYLAMLESLLLSLPSNPLGLMLLLLVFVLGLTLLFRIQKSHWIIYGLLVWFPLESLILLYTPIEYYAYAKYTPEIIMYGFVIGTAITGIQKKKFRGFSSPPMRWILAFVFVAAFSLLFNWYNPFVWALGMRQLLRFALMLLALVWMNYDWDVLKRIVFVGAAMISVEVFFGLVQYMSGGVFDKYLFSTRTVTIGNAAVLGGIEQFWRAGSRVFATMGRYDRLGSFVALGLVMLFPLLYNLKTKAQKMWFWTAGIVGTIVLVLTASRASWIAAFVGIIVIGLVLKRDRRVVVALGVFMVSLALYLMSVALVQKNIFSITEKPNQTLAERMFEAVSLHAWQESYDGYGRIFFIINTPRMLVSQYPVFGVGPGQYGGGVAAALLNMDMYDRVHLPFGIENTYGQIDNNWMSIWGETGTLGLLAWGGVLVAIFSMSRSVARMSHNREHRILAEGLAGVTVGVMIIGFFGPYYEFRAYMFYYWVLVGIVALIWYREKRKWSFL